MSLLDLVQKTFKDNEPGMVTAAVLCYSYIDADGEERLGVYTSESPLTQRTGLVEYLSAWHRCEAVDLIEEMQA